MKQVTFVSSPLGILAIGLINEALDEGDAQKTLQALQIPAAKLEGVLAEVAQHYQDTLIRAKREKAQVSGVAMVRFCALKNRAPRHRRGVSPDLLSDSSRAPWSAALCLLQASLLYTFWFFVVIVVDTSLCC